MKKLNLFFGLSLLLLLACTQDDFSDVQPEGERPRASHVVPVEDALGQAYIIGQETVDLVHCNFGWFGANDGYYISNMFQTNGPVIPDPYSGENDIENLVDKRMLSYQL